MVTSTTITTTTTIITTTTTTTNINNNKNKKEIALFVRKQSEVINICAKSSLIRTNEGNKKRSFIDWFENTFFYSFRSFQTKKRLH